MHVWCRLVAVWCPSRASALPNGVAGFAAGGSFLDRQKLRANLRVISALQIDDQRVREDARGMLAPGPSAYPRRRSSNANGLCGQNSPRILGIRASFQRDNLRFYVPRQFARAFGNDRFQGLEPYPSIAALVQFSVVKPCAPSGVR
jgi:hypothetical protein